MTLPGHDARLGPLLQPRAGARRADDRVVGHLRAGHRAVRDAHRPPAVRGRQRRGDRDGPPGPAVHPRCPRFGPGSRRRSRRSSGGAMATRPRRSASRRGRDGRRPRHVPRRPVHGRRRRRRGGCRRPACSSGARPPPAGGFAAAAMAGALAARRGAGRRSGALCGHAGRGAPRCRAVRASRTPTMPMPVATTTSSPPPRGPVSGRSGRPPIDEEPFDDEGGGGGGPWVWISGLLGLAILAVVAFLIFRLLSGPPKPTGDQVIVPNFVGQPYDQANVQATQLGILLCPRLRPDEHGAGQHDPQPGPGARLADRQGQHGQGRCWPPGARSSPSRTSRT